VLKKLRESNQEYDKSITFILIDWDPFKKHEVSISRTIPRRSTLVMIKGGREVGRLVAETGEQSIRALLDTGL
jgi:thioredoxin 1